MDQHLGASITLSFALVVFFAIVFYQPDQPPSPAPVAGAVEVARAGPVDDSIPPLTPAEPPSENLHAPRPGPASGDHRASRPDNGDASSGGSTSEQIATSDGGDPRPRPEPSAPGLKDGPGPETIKAPKHDGFTMAIEGETLKDVALRVYGPSGDDEMLWRLNRDLIDTREAVLAAGTPLRTP
jgi:hypothetical protein